MDMKTDLAKSLRAAMKRDGRTTYAFARDSGIPISTMQRFAAGGEATLRIASKLADLLGLDLSPVRRGRDGARAESR